ASKCPRASPGHHFVHEHPKAEPWMPRIKYFPFVGPVGVMLSSCTMTSERTGHWVKMRRSLARFSGLGSSVHTRSLVDFSTTTFVFRFSVHTRDRVLSATESAICSLEIISTARSGRGQPPP